MRQISLFFVLFCINSNASYEVTVLATNISNYGGFGEWSFSALYESDKESVLFDTGFHEDTVLHNAEILGKDLSKVEKVILSHYHSDHTGGLLKLRRTYKEINNKALTKNNDYSSKLASQIKKEIKISNSFLKKNLEKELKRNINNFLKNEGIKKVKEVKILNLWVVSQFKDEYNPIHYHDGDISGVGYLKVPKDMTKNKFLKNKKNQTNGTIDFINGQRGFLSKSIFNIVPKERDLLIFQAIQNLLQIMSFQ